MDYFNRRRMRLFWALLASAFLLIFAACGDDDPASGLDFESFLEDTAAAEGAVAEGDALIDSVLPNPYSRLDGHHERWFGFPTFTTCLPWSGRLPLLTGTLRVWWILVVPTNLDWTGLWRFTICTGLPRNSVSAHMRMRSMRSWCWTTLIFMLLFSRACRYFPSLRIDSCRRR